MFPASLKCRLRGDGIQAAEIAACSFMAAATERDLWLNVLAWSSILILTGAIVGQLIHRLNTEVQHLKRLQGDMQAENEKLERWVAKLAGFNE